MMNAMAPQQLVTDYAGRMNHIAICMPCLTAPHVRTTAATAMLCGHLGFHKVPFAFVSSQTSIITSARDNCVSFVKDTEKKSKIKFDWLMWIDSDMVFPQDVVLRLLQHGKAIVGCTYARRSPPYDLHGKSMDGKSQNVDVDGLVEVKALPAGMMLTHRSVFDRLPRPQWRLHYSEESGITFGEDYMFCAMAAVAGYKIWLDPQLSKEIGHISERIIFPEDAWDGKSPPNFKEKVVPSGR